LPTIPAFKEACVCHLLNLLLDWNQEQLLTNQQIWTSNMVRTLAQKYTKKMKACHQMARETAQEANNDAIEKSVKYYNSKVKPVQLGITRSTELLGQKKKTDRNIQRIICTHKSF
jgi:hypothetical protein